LLCLLLYHGLASQRGGDRDDVFIGEGVFEEGVAVGTVVASADHHLEVAFLIEALDTQHFIGFFFSYDSTYTHLFFFLQVIDLYYLTLDALMLTHHLLVLLNELVVLNTVILMLVLVSSNSFELLIIIKGVLIDDYFLGLRRSIVSSIVLHDELGNLLV
jgi:hypothetical protein